MNLFVFYENAYYMVVSAEEDFNNRVERMTHSVHTSLFYSLATPLIGLWVMNKVAMMARMGMMLELSNMDFYSSDYSHHSVPNL